MLDVASKAFFQTLSYSRHLKTLASRYGMSGERAFARRFIAGETVDEAIAAVRAIQGQGLHVTLDYLGESVTSMAAADVATLAQLSWPGFSISPDGAHVVYARWDRRESNIMSIEF